MTSCGSRPPNTALEGFLTSWGTVLSGLGTVPRSEDIYRPFLASLKKLPECQQLYVHITEKIDEGSVPDPYKYCQERPTALLKRHTVESNRVDLIDSLSHRPIAATFAGTQHPALVASSPETDKTYGHEWDGAEWEWEEVQGEDPCLVAVGSDGQTFK